MKITAQKSSLRSKLAALLLLVLAIVSTYQWGTTNDELAAAQAATVDLTGTVSLDSLPLESGTFQLTRADGQTISAPIKQGKFQLAAIPAGEWQQSLQGPGVPSLYHKAGPITIDSRVKAIQFGLKGTEALKSHALSLLERAASE